MFDVECSIISLSYLISDEESVETYVSVATDENVSDTSDNSIGVIMGLFLAPFFVIIFLISVILVLSLKR